MELSFAQWLVIGLAWIGYFCLHSLLASLTLKQWVAHRWPNGMPLYRLGFNLVALVTLLPLLAMIYLWRGEYLWQWSGFYWWLANGLAVLAVVGFFWSLKYYDGDEFIGLRQWRDRERRVEDQERLHISPLHRYVRHPWYFLGLVLIWTRDMDGIFLLSSILMTLYFVIGSWMEERKLQFYHGDTYREYCRRVPGLLPLPWRYLSAEDARRISQGRD